MCNTQNFPRNVIATSSLLYIYGFQLMLYAFWGHSLKYKRTTIIQVLTNLNYARMSIMLMNGGLNVTE